MSETRKKTKSMRFGTGKTRVPSDVHTFISSFATARGYPKYEEAVWYLVRVASSVVPFTEHGTHKSADIR